MRRKRWIEGLILGLIIAVLVINWLWFFAYLARRKPPTQIRPFDGNREGPGGV